LKDNPATRLIPFVLITGLTTAGINSAELKPAPTTFLNKPVLAEELIARVKSLLRLKEFTDELETVDSVLCTLGLIVEAATLIPGPLCRRPSTPRSGRHLGMARTASSSAPGRFLQRSGQNRRAPRY